MNTDLLKAVAAIKQSVLSDWEKLSVSPARYEYDFVQSAADKIDRTLNETLTKMYDVYGTKYVVLQAFMQLDGLLTLEMADILPGRGECEHLCINELLHILILNDILDELIAIGEDRGYFTAEGGDGTQQGSKTGHRHH